MEKYIGLTTKEVDERVRQGQVNSNCDMATKTYKEIFLGNIFTFFNFLNLALAACVAMVHSYRNMLFLGVVFWNTLIGIVQEIRAKRVLDKMALLIETKVAVWRDGKRSFVSTEEIVQDDMIEISSGEQVCADVEIVSGVCEVDESMLTGESDPVDKKTGDRLLSGSHLVSGTVTGRVYAVGKDNYANQIVKQAKTMKKVKSEIRDSIDKIIKIISVIVLPLGGIMFFKQRWYLHLPMEDAVTKTVASMISMIPDGLVLLASVVMAVSVVKLAREKAVVQELYSIENLARVDVLCLDKTGTITEGRMVLEEQLPLCEEDYTEAVCAYFTVFADDNATSMAIQQQFEKNINWKVEYEIPFSSKRKWGAVSFAGKGTYLLGAPEVLLKDQYASYRQVIAPYTEKGRRVVVFAHTKEPFSEEKDLLNVEPIVFFILKDCIRKKAKETLAYFQKQGVALKVISGDHPQTVMQIAKRAGLQNAEACVDARTLDTNEALQEAAERYTVFGRVTSEQKYELVRALQKKGHTVAMTGDGVNDVLALKEADCSIVMDSGCDVARKTAKVVLVDSDFSIMPKILAEGRRAINNLERSASLFLTKTTFATLLLAMFLIIKVSYPLQPIQFTLINAVTIGIPAFILALEPNYEVVRGRFLKKVFGRAVPAGCLAICNIALVVGMTKYWGYGENMVSTMTTVAAAIANFLLIFHSCIPWNKKRITMFVGIVVIFVLAMSFAKQIFAFDNIPWIGHLLLLFIIGMDSIMYFGARVISAYRREKSV